MAAVIETITRSGSLIINLNRTFTMEDLTGGVVCKLGFVPNDLEKIKGKPIYITIAEDDTGSTGVNTIIAKYLKSPNPALVINYGGQNIVIFPNGDGNSDDWTIVRD